MSQVIVYQDPNYSGASVALNVGDYSGAQLPGLSRVGSVRVGAGLQVLVPNWRIASDPGAPGAPAGWTKYSTFTFDYPNVWPAIDRGGLPLRVVVLPVAAAGGGAGGGGPPGPPAPPVGSALLAAQQAAYQAGYTAPRLGAEAAYKAWQAGFAPGTIQNPGRGGSLLPTNGPPSPGSPLPYGTQQVVIAWYWWQGYVDRDAGVNRSGDLNVVDPYRPWDRPLQYQGRIDSLLQNPLVTGGLGAILGYEIGSGALGSAPGAPAAPVAAPAPAPVQPIIIQQPAAQPAPASKLPWLFGAAGIAVAGVLGYRAYTK